MGAKNKKNLNQNHENTSSKKQIKPPKSSNRSAKKSQDKDNGRIEKSNNSRNESNLNEEDHNDNNSSSHLSSSDNDDDNSYNNDNNYNNNNNNNNNNDDSNSNSKKDNLNQLMGSVFDNFNLSQIKNPNFDDSDRNISIKSFSITTNAGVELFRDAALTLSYGRRYGLVGPNGRGKTTLLRHLGLRQFQMPSILDVLYCEQEVFADETSAIQMVLNADKKKLQLERRYKHVEQQIASGNLKKLETLKNLQQQMQGLGLASKESQARSILHGLGFSEEAMERPSNQFSGGWRMRISLARALFMEPSLLLLDEPTNHLDLDAVIWLDMYLSRWKKTLLIVSHDQSFLDQICTDIIHLDHSKLFYYRGNYNKFVRMFDSKQKDAMRQYEKQEKRLKEQKAKGVSKKMAKENVLKQQKRQGPGASGSKNSLVASSSDVSSSMMISSSNQMELLEKPKEYSVKFSFPSPFQINGHILGLFDVSFSYDLANDSDNFAAASQNVDDSKYIFKNVDFGIDLDTRITLVGANGVGKSTFLKLLVGDLEPSEGELQRNRNLIIGKYDQHSSDQLDLDTDATKYLSEKYKLPQFEVRKLLGQFGLESKAHTVVMKNLSGGQKSRVAFVDVALKRPHVMILDEPTNNLDIESIGALSKAIREYKGGVVIVSHDERLIRETECVLFEVKDRNVLQVQGGFDAYRERIMNLHFAQDNDSGHDDEEFDSESL